LTQDEINQILFISQKYGRVEVEKWGIRGGAIDLVTYLEIVFGYSVVRAVTKPIVEGYLKGLMGETFFKNIGERHQLLFSDEIEHLKNYLKAFYDVFIAKKTMNTQSIAIVENVEDCMLYVTLNSHSVSEKLQNHLADALVRTFALISLKLIETTDPKVIQLYPNFDTQEWDYLFIPTINAFGKYIDRYYCFSENKIYSINSASEFIEKFQITDIDEYKLIINPKER
jgi:hypothetical protein